MGVSAAGGGWALKNGWMPRTTTGLWDINSIGRVRTGGRTCLVAVLSAGHPTKESGIALVEAVARAAVGVVGPRAERARVSAPYRGRTPAPAAPEHHGQGQQHRSETARADGEPDRGAALVVSEVGSGAEVPLAVARSGGLGAQTGRAERGPGLDRGGGVDDAVPPGVVAAGRGALRAVSVRSFLIWAGVSPGCAARTSATAPETKAEAAEVPHST